MNRILILLSIAASKWSQSIWSNITSADSFSTAISVQAYKRGGHRSELSSNQDLRHHAKTKLTSDQVQEFDQFYFSRYPAIATKYLARYDTR